MTRNNIIEPLDGENQEDDVYDLVDRPVERLSNSGRFLLWAIRGWTQAAERRDCPPRALHRGFALMGAHGVLPDFHIAMALLNRDALAPMTFAPIAGSRIVEDEAVLLALWGDAARWRPERAQDMLTLLVGRDAVVPLATAIGNATRGFAGAGLDLGDLAPPSPIHQERSRP